MASRKSPAKSQAAKVVLAYSGGLDTSVILHWLVSQGHDVVAFTADVGQEDDFADAVEKALALGASSFQRVDCKQEFVTDFIFPSIRANA
ncbi:MAG: argininosuccinate synthase, partial [Chloroflexi bacterium]|nr:argininosuccinate synthase [Chloroflexota bacterium]